MESKNIERELAAEYLLNTKKHIFLTGKAGSGKTTLLKEFIDSTDKNTAVVAPTGVAAINAGGVTIHSFFQVPTTAFTPDNRAVDGSAFTNRYMLKQHMKVSKERRNVIQSLDALVIDEISMVRPDMLDTIDFCLKYIRKSDVPFGGVQLIMIGDLYQLPPVVKDFEWHTLRQYYNGPYFFNALVWNRTRMLPIELIKIYRQKDGAFLELLNHIRDGEVRPKELNLLNQRYSPKFKNEKGILTLTTHNNTANNINENKLSGLKTKPFSLRAKIEGNFKESAYPCAAKLVLKKGAQVMFIRNDKDGLYFNGKLAEIVGNDEEEELLKVKFKNDQSEHWIERATWENSKYELDDKTGTLEKKVEGSFIQYPLRLAWAVTVHKSQGLTLEEVVLDLSRSFAAGQAYVALSRCVSLEGITLLNKVHEKNVIVDRRINSFYQTFPRIEEVASRLPGAKQHYALYRLTKAFKLDLLISKTETWMEYIESKKGLEAANRLRFIQPLLQQILGLFGTANDFEKHLSIWIEEMQKDPQRVSYIYERTEKAIGYFTEAIFHKVIKPIHEHITKNQTRPNVKKYLKLVFEVYDAAWRRTKVLYDLKLFDKEIFSAAEQHKESDLPEFKLAKKQMAAKGATYEVSLTLFKEGLAIEEIAKERGMAVTTIAAHMSKWLKEGELDIRDLMDKKRIAQMEAAIEGKKFGGLKELKSMIDFDCGYDELRWMVIYLENRD